jgi:hypothetical protein
MPVQIDSVAGSGEGDGDNSTVSVGSGAGVDSTGNVGRVVGEVSCGVGGAVGPHAQRRSARAKMINVGISRLFLMVPSFIRVNMLLETYIMNCNGIFDEKLIMGK